MQVEKMFLEECNINSNKKIRLKDLINTIKTKNGQVDLSRWIFLKLNEKAVEKIWNFANKSVPSKGRFDSWKKLAKITNQNISSIKHRNERKRAKPIITYFSLIKLLGDYSNQYDFDWLEKNIVSIQFKNSSSALRFPRIWADLGLGDIDPIRVVVPLIKWELVQKNPIEKFYLKDFVKIVRIKNPYLFSKRKKHSPFKKIGKFYEVDFTKKVYIHLNDKSKKDLINQFYDKIPGLNLKIKQKNACKLLNYYVPRSLGAICRKRNQGMPLFIVLKIIKYLNNRKYNLLWVNDNLTGVSSGERKFYHINFPVNWRSLEGTMLLTTLLGDGGLGFRSSLWAWSVPHYAQFRHKELLNLYVRNTRKLFGLKIKLKERIELPAICGYMIVVSGYFVPGHKSYTNPNLPNFITKNLKLLSTSLNLLISDDGCFNKNHFSIAGGSYYSQNKPLNYMRQIGNSLKEKIPDVRITYNMDKEGTYNLGIKGGFFVMERLNLLFKKYNGGIFAKKKNQLLNNYLNNRYYSPKEYYKRYCKC
ncbi:hypothetical protein HYT57_02075 [Candidatus Woesearchaeota archaeon]|nr:hypothetical protein [Candidatus Woesearchaeota archaeon]